MWVLGAFTAVLGFLLAWQFNKSIKLGERVTMHDAEIIELRRAVAKSEADLRAALDKNESSVAHAITELKNAVQLMAGNIDTKVTALHGRLDDFLLQGHAHVHKRQNDN